MLKQRGFTLLELLVVIVIVAIMASVVVLNVSASGYSSFLADANKVAVTLELLADQAVYTNSVVACEVNVDNAGLSCQNYKNDNWQDLPLKNVVSWHWPRQLLIEKVYIDSNLLLPKQKIRFYPHGKAQQISLQLANSKYKAWVDGNLSNEFKVSN